MNISGYINGLRDQTPIETGKPKDQQLQQEDFFKLMTQQLAYQDPFKPADNAEMLSQMTAFSTSEGIASMSKQMESLNSVMTSSQALQASSLVGQRVLLPVNTGHWDGKEPVGGVIVTGEGTGDLTITVENEQGQTVRTLNLSGPHQGNVSFTWDGMDNDGDALESGNYNFKVNGLVNGTGTEFNALLFGKVSSVTLGSGNNPNLVNVVGLGGVPLDKVLEIAGGTTA